ncbi:MAG TPA: tripartite tricarboxylate transporter substrate binding protein [Thermosynergistes sp.]|nr:tripartite tricarboxylate transporter substrate binding protein [Thermosynergistes sp.]
MRRFLTSCAILVLVFGVMMQGQMSAAAADFPTKPVTIVCPYAAGGSSDMMTRVLASVAPKYLGQSVVVLNRPGANGAIGAAEVARAHPDGYTVLQIAAGAFTTVPLTRPVQYSIDDFRGVIGTSYEPIILTVNAKSPWRTTQDLIDDAKETGKVIKYGISGTGGSTHAAPAALFDAAGVKAEAVPFEGGGPAITALVGGHVDAATSHPTECMPQVEAGNLRALGIFSQERFAETPDVPTFKEQGFDLPEFSVWKMLLVPAKTPDDAVEKLHAAFKQSFEDPEYVEAMARMKLTIQYLAPDEIIPRLKKEYGMYKAIMEKLGLVKQ